MQRRSTAVICRTFAAKSKLLQTRVYLVHFGKGKEEEEKKRRGGRGGEEENKKKRSWLVGGGGLVSSL